MNPQGVTHEQATVAAIGCLVVQGYRMIFDEAVWGDWRIDVIGIGRRDIVAIEVKVSRPDFLKDFVSGPALEAQRARAAKRLADLERRAQAADAELRAKAVALGYLGVDAHDVLDKHIGAYVRLPEFAAVNEACRVRNNAIRTLEGLGAKKATTLLAAGLAHRHYICTPPGLVAPEEVPVGWGLMEASGRGAARVVVQVKRRTVASYFAVRRRWINRCAMRCACEARDLRRRLLEKARK